MQTPLHRFRPGIYLEALFNRNVNDAVIAGPFAGMTYGRRSVCGRWHPKMLGIYEKELHPIVETLASLAISRIIDIGAAEGFYACGLTRILPHVKCIAFEADLVARYLLRRSIELNRLNDRVEVMASCDVNGLSQAMFAPKETLILCDAEGAECELLDIERLPVLRHAKILVEVHEFYIPGITELLKRRFGDTHRIQEIQAVARTREDFPWHQYNWYTRMIPSKYYMYFVEERPPGMSWLWMQPS